MRITRRKMRKRICEERCKSEDKLERKNDEYNETN